MAQNLISNSSEGVVLPLRSLKRRWYDKVIPLEQPPQNGVCVLQSLVKRHLKTILLFLIVLIVACGKDGDHLVFKGRKAINGTLLYIEEYGSGQSILFVHGGPGLNHSYIKPNSLLLAKTFNLISFDQRGSGKSSLKVNKTSINLETFAEDIDGIIANMNLNQPSLLAHSWGAIPAIKFVLANPGKISSLILLNPVPLSTKKQQKLSELQSERQSKKERMQFKKVLSSKALKDGKREAYDRLYRLSFKNTLYDTSKIHKLNLNLTEDHHLTATLITELRRDNGYDLYTDIETITTPTLIIKGESDPLPLSYIDLMLDKLPNSQKVIVPHSGHFPFLETPKETTKLITNFIN